MEIRASGPSDAYTKVLRELLEAPKVAPRGLGAREIGERVTVVIERPYGLVRHLDRKFNHAISVLEGLSLIGQTSLPELQTDRVGVLAKFMSGGVNRGAYGPRVEGSLFDIVNLLKADPWSRQAVLSIYGSQRDLGRWNEHSVSGDVPCTLNIQFLIRDNLLHMWVMMRSNDAWRGLPYDLGQFVFLQNAIGQALGIHVGPYTHSVGSMHLYDEHYDSAKDLVWTRALPYEHPVAWPVFGCKPDIVDIAGRARQILLGVSVVNETNDEQWMATSLDMAQNKQVITW